MKKRVLATILAVCLLFSVMACMASAANVMVSLPWGFKNVSANAEDVASIPGLGRSPGEGNVNPLQDSCLQNPPWTEEVGHSPWGCKESDMTERLHSHSHDAKREGKGSSP